MGVTTWTFEWDGQGWRRLSSRWLDRLFNGQERVEGRTELLTTSVPVELLERMPVAVGKPQFHRWPLKADGTLDKDRLMQAVALVMPPIPPFEKTSGNLIEAEDRFNRRRHRATAQWEPSREQQMQLATELRNSGMTARLADLAFE